MFHDVYKKLYVCVRVGFSSKLTSGHGSNQWDSGLVCVVVVATAANAAYFFFLSLFLSNKRNKSNTRTKTDL